MSSYFFRVVVAVLASTFAVLGQVRCASAQVPYLEPLDPSRRHLFGQHYNPEKYRACLNQIRGADIQCDYLRLRRKEQPEYWPNPNVPRPKLPDPPSPPVYREGMTSKQYFDALCKAEAGEFIYQTVDSVQGVYQIRPRVSEEGNAEQQDRYVMEDPFGYGSLRRRPDTARPGLVPRAGLSDRGDHLRRRRRHLDARRWVAILPVTKLSALKEFAGIPNPGHFDPFSAAEQLRGTKGFISWGTADDRVDYRLTKALHELVASPSIHHIEYPGLGHETKEFLITDSVRWVDESF